MQFQGEFAECKKFQWGWPMYFLLLEQMFRRVVVDGSTSCIPGMFSAHACEEQAAGGGTDTDGYENSPMTVPAARGVVPALVQMVRVHPRRQRHIY